MVRNRVRFLVVAVTTLVGLVACSVNGQSSATRIKPEEVPFQLLNQTTTTLQAPSTTERAQDSAQLFFVRDGRLAPVTRTGVLADPQSVLALLSGGPSDTEAETGLRSALVPELAVMVDIVGNVVTIDLNEEFSSLSPTEQRLALAQITYTLTQLPSIDMVRFLVTGQAASVPRGDGSTTDGPVDQSDYAELAPP